MKKRIATNEEIANDPSLRWFPYRFAELLHSDTHNQVLRFVRYEGDNIRMATLDGISEIKGSDGLVYRMFVRRPSAVPEPV